MNTNEYIIIDLNLPQIFEQQQHFYYSNGEQRGTIKIVLRPTQKPNPSYTHLVYEYVPKGVTKKPVVIGRGKKMGGTLYQQQPQYQPPQYAPLGFPPPQPNHPQYPAPQYQPPQYPPQGFSPTQPKQPQYPTQQLGQYPPQTQYAPRTPQPQYEPQQYSPPISNQYSQQHHASQSQPMQAHNPLRNQTQTHTQTNPIEDIKDDIEF